MATERAAFGEAEVEAELDALYRLLAEGILECARRAPRLRVVREGEKS
jgi:hypothetical protein